MNKNQLDNFFAQFDFGGDSVSSPGEWQEDEKDHFSCVFTSYEKNVGEKYSFHVKNNDNAVECYVLSLKSGNEVYVN